MTQRAVYDFLEALRTLEQDGDVEPIAATFGSSCEIGTPLRREKLYGPKSARQFWLDYRGAFQRIDSTIHNIVMGDYGAAIEWTAEAVAVTGKPLHFHGITVIDVDGGKISRMRAYFEAEAVSGQAVTASQSAAAAT